MQCGSFFLNPVFDDEKCTFQAKQFMGDNGIADGRYMDENNYKNCYTQYDINDFGGF